MRVEVLGVYFSSSTSFVAFPGSFERFNLVDSVRVFFNLDGVLLVNKKYIYIFHTNYSFVTHH